jgi:hypothetical protein
MSAVNIKLLEDAKQIAQQQRKLVLQIGARLEDETFSEVLEDVMPDLIKLVEAYNLITRLNTAICELTRTSNKATDEEEDEEEDRVENDNEAHVKPPVFRSAHDAKLPPKTDNRKQIASRPRRR